MFPAAKPAKNPNLAAGRAKAQKKKRDFPWLHEDYKDAPWVEQLANNDSFIVISPVYGLGNRLLGVH